MTDDVRDRLAALEHEVACSNVPTILGALDLFIAKLQADPSLLVVAKPKCPTCQGGTVHRVKTSPGARHTVPCPDCDTGYLPMVAIPAKVAKEWATVVRFALCRDALPSSFIATVNGLSPEAIRLAREEE